MGRRTQASKVRKEATAGGGEVDWGCGGGWRKWSLFLCIDKCVHILVKGMDQMYLLTLSKGMP